MFQKIKFKILFLLACLLLFQLAGCQNLSKQPESKSGFFFDTTINITIYETKKSLKKETLLDECFDLCSVYEKMFSRTLEGSDIYRINRAKGQPVQVSSETASLIEKSIFYSEQTGGVFDCSIAPLSILWDFSSTAPVKPSDKSIQEACSLVDYRNITIEGKTVTLKQPEMSLDLGAIAKGYIADQIKSYLISHDVSSALINLGGNVLAIGTKPDGLPYHIGIQNPFDAQAQSITSAAITDKSLVTSGIYERYFEEDGVIYHHLLDPASGYPFSGNLYSVTILSPSSADADALSTSCFGLGLTKGMELIENLDDTEALFITDDHKLHYTSGFPRE